MTEYDCLGFQLSSVLSLVNKWAEERKGHAVFIAAEAPMSFISLNKLEHVAVAVVTARIASRVNEVR